MQFVSFLTEERPEEGSSQNICKEEHQTDPNTIHSRLLARLDL